MYQEDSRRGENSNVNNNVTSKSLKPDVPSKPQHLNQGTKNLSTSIPKDIVTPKGWSPPSKFNFNVKDGIVLADKSLDDSESMFSPKWRPAPRVLKKQQSDVNDRDMNKFKDDNANRGSSPDSLKQSSPALNKKEYKRPHSTSLSVREDDQPGFGSLKRMWSQKSKDGENLPGLSSPPVLRNKGKVVERSPLSKNNASDMSSSSSDRTDSPQSLSRSESSSSNGSFRTASFKDRSQGSWHCVIARSPTNSGDTFVPESFPSQIEQNETVVTDNKNKKFHHSILTPRPFRPSSINEEGSYSPVRTSKSRPQGSAQQIGPMNERREIRKSSSDDSNTSSPDEELDREEREMREARKLGTLVTRFDKDGNMYSVDPRTGKVDSIEKENFSNRIPEAIYSDEAFVEKKVLQKSVPVSEVDKSLDTSRNIYHNRHSHQRSQESSSDEAPPPLLPRERISRHSRSRMPIIPPADSSGRQRSITSKSMYSPKNRNSHHVSSKNEGFGGINPNSAVPPPLLPRENQPSFTTQDYTPMSGTNSEIPSQDMRSRTSTSSLNSFLDQVAPAYEPMGPKEEEDKFPYSPAVDPPMPRPSDREYHEIDPDPDVPVGQVPPPPDCEPPTLPEGVARSKVPPASPPPLPPLNPAQKKLNYIEVEIGSANGRGDNTAVRRKSPKTNYTEVIIGGASVGNVKEVGEEKKGISVKGKIKQMFASKHHDGYNSEGDIISATHKKADDDRTTDFAKERNKLKRLSGRILGKKKHKSKDYSHQSSIGQESSSSTDHHAVNNNKEIENIGVYGSVTNLSSTSSGSTRSLSQVASSNSGSSGDGQARIHYSQGVVNSSHTSADRRQSHEPHRTQLPPKLNEKSRSEVQLNVEMNLSKTYKSSSQNNVNEYQIDSTSTGSTHNHAYQAHRSGQNYGDSQEILAPRVHSHLHQQRGTKVLPVSPRPVSEPPAEAEFVGDTRLTRPLSTPFDVESRRSPRPDMVRVLPLPAIKDIKPSVINTDQEQLSPNFPLDSPPSPPPLDSLPPLPTPETSESQPPAPMRNLKPDRFRKNRASRDLSASDAEYSAAQDIPSININQGRKESEGDPIYDDVEFDPSLKIQAKTPLSASSKSKLLESEPLYQVYRSRTLSHASTRNRNNTAAQRRRFKSAVQAKRQSEDRWQSDLMTDDAGATTLWKEVKEVAESGIGVNLTNDEMKLQQAQFEVVTSQASYMRSLNILIDHFMRDWAMESTDILPRKKRKELFSNIIAVQEIEQRFLQDIEQHFWEKLYLTDIANITARYATSEFEVYVRYVQNQVYQDRVLTDLQRNNEKFAEELARLESSPFCNKLPLLSFLLLPMQRVTRLPLLISAIVNQADSAGDKKAYTAAKQALAVVNKLVKKCNEGARKMQQTEQLAETVRELTFAPKVKTYALVSQSRSVVKKGEMMVTMVQENKKTKVMKLWLFLFSDVLLLARKKNFLEAGTNIKYEVIDWAKRACLYVNERAVSENEIFLVLLENCLGKRVELTLTPTSLNELSRWTDVLNPQRIDESEDSIYESWDCPQYICIVPYTAQQPDELTLDVGDVMRVLKKTGDGWLEGERLRDDEQGWFPAENCEEIEDEHVRARNLRNLYRIIPAGGVQE